MTFRITSALVGASLLAIAVATPLAARAQSATAFQIDRGHTGVVTMQTPLTLPLKQLWKRTLPGAVSYPVIADGRVFVVTAGVNGGYGTQVWAFDKATGTRLWMRSTTGTYFWAGHTYGNGLLYVVNYDGRMQALDGATGKVQWTRQLPGQYAFSSPPTYSNGMVYTGGAGSGGTVYAVDATNGVVKWTGSVMNGDNSSPAVSDNAVYVAYACNNAYAFNPTTGASIWTHFGTCEGGGGRTPVIDAGTGGLYSRDWAGPNLVLNLRTGKQQGPFTAGPPPAMDGANGYFVYSGVLTARDVVAHTKRWSFSGAVSAPIVVDGWVFVGDSNGGLYALDSSTGNVAWSTTVGAAINAPDEQNVSQPLTGLSAGEGVVAVPASNVLAVYGN